jgi:hypothetical protein
VYPFPETSGTGLAKQMNQSIAHGSQKIFREPLEAELNPLGHVFSYG